MKLTILVKRREKNNDAYELNIKYVRDRRDSET